MRPVRIGIPSGGILLFSAIARVFRTPDLRRKIAFTLAIIALYRLGAHIPAPFVDFPNVQSCLRQSAGTEGLLSLVNLFSGGALLQLSIFALGVMPYITATIIVQLLRVVIPHFETLYKEGQAGQSRLTQYTRYLTIALALLQSTTLVTVARSGQLFGTTGIPECEQLLTNDVWWAQLLMIITMTAGTGLIMWFAELVTEKGIGNGMSILIFTSIAAAFPASMWAIWQSKGFEVFLLVLGVGILVVALVVYVEQSQRRIPVQYAKRMVGRRTYGGTNTYIPIKVNMAGVVPVIFASSLLYIPALIAQFNQPQAGQTAQGWVAWIAQYLTTGDSPLYMLVYFLLIVGFTYFYVAITFNPVEVADNMKKYGGFIPGIRAGSPDGRVPRLRAHAHHAGRFALPGLHRPAAAHRPGGGRREPELPVRRRLDPDHRRCRSRDGQADRRAASAAPLRRTSAMTAAHSARLLIVGPQGSGKGTQGIRIADAYGIPAISTGDMFRAAIASKSDLGTKVTEIIQAGNLVPDELTTAVVRERLSQDGCRPRLPAGRLPPQPRSGRRPRRVPLGPRRRARRRDRARRPA